MPQPFLLVIAGPNGSGKTTLTAHLRKHGIDFGYYINPDDFAASLEGSPEERSHRAQAKADEEREVCLVTFTSFSFETVMSHPSKVDVMRRARSLGFHVTLFFVGVEEPTINIARVAQRVAQGGHDVPRDRIVARYHRTMALLPDAVVAADRSVIFDNTAPNASFIGSIAIDVGLMSTSSPLTPILGAALGRKSPLRPTPRLCRLGGQLPRPAVETARALAVRAQHPIPPALSPGSRARAGRARRRRRALR